MENQHTQLLVLCISNGQTYQCLVILGTESKNSKFIAASLSRFKETFRLIWF